MVNRHRLKVRCKGMQTQALPRQKPGLSSLAMLVLLLFVSIPTNALDFGSVAKNDAVHIKSGEIAKFALLFWSRDVAEQSVKLTTEAPDGWTVLINPASFQLSRSIGSEYVSIGRESIRAVPVTVTAIPGAFGTDYIKLKAVAGIPSGDISFFQERIITLAVHVESQVDITLGEIEVSGETTTGEESGSDKTVAAGRTTIGSEAAEVAEEEGGDDMLIFFVLAVIIIIIISVIIYRSGQRRSELEELKQLLPRRG